MPETVVKPMMNDMQVNKVPEATTEERLRAALAEAGVTAHSISFGASALHVKTAFVRLPAPPLPWGPDGSGTDGAADDAQASSLADVVQAEDAVPDAGGVNVAGGRRACQTFLQRCTMYNPVDSRAASCMWGCICHIHRCQHCHHIMR